jgi:hypothetical protein
LLYRGDGAGYWLNTTGTVIGAGFSSMRSIFSPGDFNGDGNSDVMTVLADGTIKLFTGNGSGGWISGSGSGAVIGTGWSTMKQIAGPGDFDGDGNPDIITIRSNGELWLYTGNGTGSWINAVGVKIGSGW